MITQTIQRWLNKLFAWWPWTKASERAYAQSIANVSKGTTQDPTGRATVDGTLPQAGSMSIAVEHELVDPDQPATDEHAEPFAQSPPAAIPGEHTSPSPISATDSAREAVAFPRSKDVPAPTPEQNLAFLQYLVKRGTFNEGFSSEQMPDQYRQDQQ